MSQLHNLSPTDVLDERLALRALTDTPLNPERMDAFFLCAALSIQTVLEAAAHGNVRCELARREMLPHLVKLLPKK